MKIIPKIKDLTVEEAKKDLKKSKIDNYEIVNRFSLASKKGYVFKIKPKDKLKEKEILKVYVSKGRILPIILFLSLFVLMILSVYAYFLYKAPTVKQEDKGEWAESQVIEIVEDATVPDDEVEYYLYCISDTNDISTCEWKRTDTKNIEIGLSGKWYVWFKAVTKKNKESKVSKVEIVKIDNDAPIVNDIRTESTESTIKVYVNASDNLSGNIRYYYSIDGSKFVEDEDTHLFEGLNSNTWYEIKVKIVDAAGNEYVVETKAKTDSSDNTLKVPYIDLSGISSVLIVGADHKVPTNVVFDSLGGETKCVTELDEEIDNTSQLTYGSHTITCKAVGNNGLSSTVSKDVEVEGEGADEIFDGWIKLNLFYPAGSTERQWRVSDPEYSRDGDGSTSWQPYTGPIVVRIDQANSIYIKYVLNGETIIEAPNGELVVDIEPEDYQVHLEHTLKVKINYDQRAEEKLYRIDGGEWLPYEGEFEVGPKTKIDAKARSHESLYDENGDVIYSKVISSIDSVFINQTKDISVSTLIAPERDEVEKGQKTRVFIYYFGRSNIRQYRINGGEWQDYNEPFLVGPETRIESRVIRNNPADTDSDSLYIDTYVPQMFVNIYAEDTSLYSNQTTNVEISALKRNYVAIDYRIGNNGSWQSYTNGFSVGPRTVIYARARRTDGENKTVYDRQYIGLERDGYTGGPYHYKDRLNVTINPKNSSLEEGETTKVKINYDSRGDIKQYKIGEGEWQNYTGEFEVGPETVIYARIFKSDNSLRAGYSTRVIHLAIEKETDPPVDRLTTTVNVTKTEIKMDEKTKVKITYDERADIKQYKINNGEWQDYSGEFEVGPFTSIESRAAKSDNSISEGKDLDYVDLYEEPKLELSVNPEKATIKEGETTPVYIYADSRAEVVEYRINDEDDWHEYNSSTSIIVGPKTSIEARAAKFMENQNDLITVSGAYVDLEESPVEKEPKPTDFAFDGPVIRSSVTTRTLKTTISITTEYEARNIYYSFDGLDYKKYEGPFELTSNQTIKAYYIRESDGLKSLNSVLNVSNISNGPVLAINTNPSVDVSSNIDSTVATITGEYYVGKIEYSFDNIMFNEYTGPITISNSSTIYARAYDANGIEGRVKKVITLGTPPKTGGKKFDVKILSDNICPSDGSLLNDTQVTISFDSRAVGKYYKLNDDKNWTQYTGPITLEENATIHAYGTNFENLYGYDDKMIDCLSEKQAQPIINISPETAASEITISIEFDRNSIVREYSLDGENYQEYTESFNIYENTIIYARGYDAFGNMVSASKEVTNYLDLPRGVILDKGKYLILTLNYPQISTGREYKWMETGEWKAYPETGIVLVKPQYKDEFDETAAYYVIEDNAGNLVQMSPEHVYFLDTLSSEIFSEIFMRWDNYPPEGPQFVEMISEPCRENRVYILFDPNSIYNEYKIVSEDGTQSEWIEYSGGIDIYENNTMIIARSLNDLQLYSDETYHKVTNIDTGLPEIEVTGDFINPTRTLQIRISATDDGKIDNVKFDGREIDNNSTVDIEDNGVYWIHATDTLGKENSKRIEVTNIDREEPNITVHSSIIDPLDGSIGSKISIDIDFDDAVVKKYSFNNSDWLDYNEPIIVTSNDNLTKLDDGSFVIYVYAEDLAGNNDTIQKYIYDLDLDLPGDANITILSDYPKLSVDGVAKKIAAKIEYDDTYEVKNYYCVKDCDNEENYSIYKGTFVVEENTLEVYAKSIKTLSNAYKMNSKVVEAENDELQRQAYDNDESTFASLDSKRKLLLDNKLSNYMLSAVIEGNTEVCFYKDDNSIITCDRRDSSKREIKYFIPKDATFVTFEGGSIYEVRLSDKEVLVNSPVIKISDEGEWTRVKTIDITYPSNSYTNEYSLDYGQTWNRYSTPFVITEPETIIARSLSDNKYVSSSSYKVVNIDNKIPDKEYGCTGSIDEYSAPYYGKYRVDIYGAQGGSLDDIKGGLGGYVSGTLVMGDGQTFYVGVGCQGTKDTAGFNGGGEENTNGASGGGATHFASKNLGTLNNYENDIDSLILVAGAGGGAGTGEGGAGGLDAASGQGIFGIAGTPGTLTEAGLGGNEFGNGSFGLGGSIDSDNPKNYSGAGGAGYFGGGAGGYSEMGYSQRSGFGGSGGSSYISNMVENPTEKTGVNEGDGRIIITLLEKFEKHDATLSLDFNHINITTEDVDITKPIHYDGDGSLVASSSDENVVKVYVNENNELVINPGPNAGSATVTLNANSGYTYNPTSTTFTVENKLSPFFRISENSRTTNKVVYGYTYVGPGTVTVTSSGTAGNVVHDQNAKTITITANALGTITATISITGDEEYASMVITKTYQMSDPTVITSSNDTAFQSALTKWGTIGTATDASWYGTSSKTDTKIQDASRGDYVIVETINTNNWTGYYYQYQDENGKWVVPQYKYTELDFDMTSTDGDDDVMGAMIRFNPQGFNTTTGANNNNFTGYIFLIDNHDSSGSGYGNGYQNGLWKSTGKQFSRNCVAWSTATTASTHQCTNLTRNRGYFWARRQWQHYKFIADGSSLKVYRWSYNTSGTYKIGTGSTLLYSATDSTYSTGTYGFWTDSQAYAQFKNFKAITRDIEGYKITDVS